MISIGKKQTLTIVKKTDFGAYLSDTSDRENSKEEVLLPLKEVPTELEVHDPIDVFVYRDSKDRLIATTRTPKIMLGRSGILTVKDVNRVGAFLDWGLEKDLLLPFKEQKGSVAQGDEVCVSLYVDKSSRLCATMWVSGEEKKQSIYDKNAGKLEQIIKKNGNLLPVGDKSSPEEIKKLTGMSKNEFKKAVGKLYKDRKIIPGDNEIRIR